MKKLISISLLFLTTSSFASDVVPIGHGNNQLYYKIGGSNNFSLPPVSSTDSISINTNSNLGLGYSCGAFNPALSIVNAMNDLKDSLDNLTKDILANATGSLIEMPMYELARSNPTLYALLNNQLLSSHDKLTASIKSCEVVKQQITNGQNPYRDWGTIAINDQWKKKLSLISSGDADINHAKADIEARSGDDGVTWVNGNKDNEGNFHSGGIGQPPVHVIADTVKSGYNALLNRDLQSDDPAPMTGASAELANYFPTPSVAENWITNVIGDQTITTCNDDSCKKNQTSFIGHGLLPWVTSCDQDKDNCVPTIRDELGKLVTGNDAITKNNLEKVSADGIAMSPDAISSIRTMDPIQQSIIINKLAQEIAVQRVIDKAFIARNILSTGEQVPIIASNHPAKMIIHQGISNLDNDIHSLTFESDVKKQMMSNTLSEVLDFSNQQQQQTMQATPVSSPQTLMENGAIQNGVKK